MESFIRDFLGKKGYAVNDDAQEIIRACDDWYANKVIEDFHRRRTVQGAPYELHRMNFAKRGCSDDANLCEVLEINAGKNRQQDTAVNDILSANEFNTQYRKQLERTSAAGTVACYVRLDNATILDNGKAEGGTIRLNYVEAGGFLPLTVENDIITEAAFCGCTLKQGKKQTTLVLFTKNENGLYTAETHVFDKFGNEIKEMGVTVVLGDVRPFAVMRNAEVNNLANMDGYGLPKLWNAVPVLKGLDLCFGVLFGDLDKADKLLLINELLCGFDENGKPITPNEQAKKIFVMLGEEKLPQEKSLVQEYNPVIRIEEITKTFELCLSLLSMMFGYGTRKYGFENGRITTATEYSGERQDMLQELNRQRQEATRYIQDICRAVMWFSNTFQGTAWDLGEEICVEFDDSYITDKAAELEAKRADALSFADIPVFRVLYVMERLNCTEEEAKKYIAEGAGMDEEDEPED